MKLTAPAFEDIHAGHADPWAVRTRWYEERKRALTLALLPRRRYGVGFEPGCSIGELSHALAPRCDRLLAWDASSNALASARERLAGLPHVELSERAVPRDWPDEPLDLIVLSEIGYFIPEAEFSALVARTAASLAPGGTVLLCHWRYPFENDLDGDEVHARFERESGLQVTSRVEERDVLLAVFTHEGRSVAQEEGFI